MASLLVGTKILMMSNAKRVDQATRRMVLLEVAYKLFVAQVYTLCFHLLANSSAAEEATAMVFTRFSREVPRRWDEARVGSRLRELAIDEAVQRLFGDVVANASRARAVKVGAPPAPDKTTVQDGKLAHREQARLDSPLLKELIARLPDDLRVGFVLYDMEGLKEQDVAKYLGVHESEVRALVKRARMELRRLWLSRG
jgi:RNA polymerase sigma-70 factor (ECF subfamily)